MISNNLEYFPRDARNVFETNGNGKSLPHHCAETNGFNFFVADESNFVGINSHCIYLILLISIHVLTFLLSRPNCSYSFKYGKRFELHFQDHTTLVMREHLLSIARRPQSALTYHRVPYLEPHYASPSIAPVSRRRSACRP
jgi:hypothetical protein